MKENSKKVKYLFLSSFILYIWAWIAQTSSDSFYLVSWILWLVILVILELIYYLILQGSWKVFLPLVILLVLLYLDPMYLYQKSVFGRYIPLFFCRFFDMNQDGYVTGQANICLMGRLVLIARLVLFTPIFPVICGNMQKRKHH